MLPLVLLSTIIMFLFLSPDALGSPIVPRVRAVLIRTPLDPKDPLGAGGIQEAANLLRGTASRIDNGFADIIDQAIDGVAHALPNPNLGSL
ncbi:hypothetical protein FRB94_005030 [Tulasnella sp. JGI-2019a]|nr:hypothetical protein FRB94_005030 [Tulasnella sp. JGI-2019a]